MRVVLQPALITIDAFFCLAVVLANAQTELMAINFGGKYGIPK